MLAQLPGKTERVERCPLTRGQLELYQREVEGARREMGNGAGEGGREVECGRGREGGRERDGE